MARQKIKNFCKKFAFFLEFSQYFFNFLLILMHIFEKLPQILGRCPRVKFRTILEKSDPPNMLWTPLNRKILHKLLHVKVNLQELWTLNHIRKFSTIIWNIRNIGKNFSIRILQHNEDMLKFSIQEFRDIRNIRTEKFFYKNYGL